MHDLLLEKILRSMRINKILPYIKAQNQCVLLDIGCGIDYQFLKCVHPHVLKAYGIDFKISNIHLGNIILRKAFLKDKLPFDNNYFDIITMLAVLEHLPEPLAIISEIHRVLKNRGKLILTVPSKLSKPILEFLSFKLGIINAEEMKDHKAYYNLSDLKRTIKEQAGLHIERHHYFQFGMNNFCVISKAKANQKQV